VRIPSLARCARVAGDEVEMQVLDAVSDDGGVYVIGACGIAESRAGDRCDAPE
jgi:hypothetical protein